MKRLVLMLLLSLAWPAMAASLDEARATATARRGAAQTWVTQQEALRSELEILGRRIEALKAQRRGKWAPGSELERALQKSQELSSELTLLAQRQAQAQSAFEKSALILESALTLELQRLRQSWDTRSTRPARLLLIDRMRALRAERESVRASLPTAQLPTLSRSSAGDDPEDLLEEADALRDAEDKVRSRLKALQGRIAEVKEERSLDARMNDFLGDESLFDEQDRRLRLQPGASASREAAPAADTQESAAPGGAGGSPAFSPEAPVLTPSPQAPATVPHRAEDARPQVGRVGGPSLAGSLPEDLGSLEQQAQALQELAGQLRQRAQQLEQRGRRRE